MRLLGTWVALFLVSLPLAVSASMDRGYLKKTIPHYPFKGVEKFYELTAIYKDPALFRYIVDSFAGRAHELGADYIAAPEARALPIFGAVIAQANLPGLFIRKQGKTPGEVHRVQYGTTYSKEALEIPVSTSLASKKVVIIDDGISSGGTMLAAIQLMEDLGLEVVGCFAVVNHQYASREEYGRWEEKTLSLFDL